MKKYGKAYFKPNDNGVMAQNHLRLICAVLNVLRNLKIAMKSFFYDNVGVLMSKRNKFIKPRHHQNAKLKPLNPLLSTEHNIFFFFEFNTPSVPK